MTFGRKVANVCMVERDKTKLGSFCWTKLGDSGKITYTMTMYMSHNKANADTKIQTEWYRHKSYYTSKGMVDKEPC